MECHSNRTESVSSWLGCVDIIIQKADISGFSSFFQA